MMRRSCGITAVTLIGLLAVSCAARPAPPRLDREQVERVGADFAESRVDALIEDRKRLLAIEYAIATTVAPRCGKLSWSHAGVLLASSDSFGDEVIREDIETRFGRAARSVVASLVPGSGFDRAGIRVGDRLLSIDGSRIDEADDLTRHLIEHRDRRDFEVRYDTGGREVEARVEFDAACPVVLSPEPSHLLSTYRNERLLVAVPVGLSTYIEDDDLLASIVAHEMAHALFDRDEEGPLDAERRADREGLLLAARAGFDVSKLPDYWSMLALEYPWLIDARQPFSVNDARSKPRPIDHRYAFAHYHIGERLPVLREAVARITAQVAASAADESSEAAEPGDATKTSP